LRRSSRTARRFPKNVSLTDPEARWTAAPGGPAFYAYSTNYLVDVDAGIIVDVEATTALRTDEVDSARSMLERVEDRFGLKPERLIADTAYGTGPMLGWLVEEKEIEPARPGLGQVRAPGRHVEPCGLCV
jgi:Transposase DDE domain